MRRSFVPDESAMVKLAQELVADFQFPEVVYLSGELGAGKTTLVRGILTCLGHVGAVKSPTYTLYESYQLPASHTTGQVSRTAHHFDLYRLNDPDELEYIGFRDLLDADLILIEWPDRGGELLPRASLTLEIGYTTNQAGSSGGLGRDVIITRVE